MPVVLKAGPLAKAQPATPRAPKARIATVRVACPHCGATEGEIIATGKDHEYDNTTSDLFSMQRCRCGLVYLNPRPAPSELRTIYPPNYYAYTRLTKTERGPRGDSALANLFKARNVRRFRPMAQTLQKSHLPPYRILDIGCGDGTPLNYWREALGGQAETYGVEMNDDAARIAREHGHRVTAKRVEEITTEIPLGTFDLVYSSNVIEHVESPFQFLQTTRAALQAGGYAMLDTPNTDCVDFRLFKAHWGGFHYPRHWSLFDARTFSALAERAGFQVLSVTYLPAPVFWVWSFHSLLQPRWPRLAARLFPPVEIMTRGSVWNFVLLSLFTALEYLGIVTLGTCGQMRVLLRRKD